MKMLFLSHRIPWPVRDGGALAIHNNLKGFVEARVQVKLLCLNPIKDQTSTTQLPAYFQSTEIETVSIQTAVKPLGALLNLFGSASYHVTRFYHADFEKLLIKVLQEETFDVVHMEGAYIAQYTDLVRKNSQACIVLREHNVEYRIWELMAASEKNFLKSTYLKLLAKRLKKYEENLWRKVDLIAAISADDLTYFKKVNENSFLGGVGFYFQDGLSELPTPKPKSLFHLGSMDWLPNQEAVSYLLDAIWPLVHENLPEYSLHLAGKHMPKEWQRNSDQLVIEGEVASAADFMASFEIMLVPLKSGSGVRIKTIEAMALGKVVITTELGLKGIDAQPGREVLVANTPEEFLKAIQWLENEPEKKNEMGRNAEVWARKNYANENHIARLTEKYRTCGRK